MKPSKTSLSIFDIPEVKQSHDEILHSKLEIRKSRLIQLRDADGLSSLAEDLHSFSFDSNSRKGLQETSSAELSISLEQDSVIQQVIAANRSQQPPERQDDPISYKPPRLTISTDDSSAFFGEQNSPLYTPRSRISPSDVGPYAACVTDTDGSILTMNQAMRALAGINNDHDKVVIWDLFDRDSRDYQLDRLSGLEYKKDGQVLQSGRIVHIMKRDSIFPASVWTKLKATNDGFTMLWAFEAMQECVVQADLDMETAKLKLKHGEAQKLFETSQSVLALKDVFPNVSMYHMTSTDGQSNHCAVTSQQKEAFPVVIRSTITGSIAKMTITALPFISGAMAISKQKDEIMSCSTAVAFYLLGTSSAEIVGQKPSTYIPWWTDISAYAEKAASNQKSPNSMLPSALVGKFVAEIAQNASPTDDSDRVPNVPSDGKLRDKLYIRHQDGNLIGVKMQVQVYHASGDQTFFRLWITFEQSERLEGITSQDPLTSPTRKNDVTSFSEQEEEPLKSVSMVDAKTSLIQSPVLKERQWSDYKIIKQIGEGAFGFVEIARNTASSARKEVVLKHIYKSRIMISSWRNDKELGTIPSEIEVLHFLRKHPHPNLTRMTALFQDDHYIHLEMALFGNGMDLFDYIENTADIPESECRRLFHQACLAVNHLHHHGIVHRDIKDENIIIDTRKRIQLIDFGSAAYTSEGPFRTFCGTLEYASPEVLAGYSYEGPPQDCWALGILLFTMAFKENPFGDVDDAISATIRLPSSLSGEFEKLLRKLLSKRPHLRPTASEILQHEWFQDDPTLY